MGKPWFEKMCEYQWQDRLKEAELDRLARTIQDDGTPRLKQIAFLGEVVLVALAIVVILLI